MSSFFTLTNEMYKYCYGNFNPFCVPFACVNQYSLTCARNDRAACQLLIYSEEPLMLSLEESPAFYKCGPRKTLRVTTDFPGLSDCRISLAFLDPVRDDDGNYKSEILSGRSKKELPERMVQPVYLELETGEKVPSGLHTGSVRIFESSLLGDETLLFEGFVSLRVLPVTLPSPADFGFYLDLWQHPASVARTYEVPLFSEEHFRLLKPYLKALSQLGQKAVTVIVSEAPWSGQWSAYCRTNPSDCFEYSMVRLTRDRKGDMRYDFSAMNRYIRLCMECGIREEIEIFGLAGIWTMPDAGFGGVLADSDNAVRLRYRNESDGAFYYIRRNREYRDFLRALWQNLSDNGWVSLARIACDEPDSPQKLSGLLKILKEDMPHVRIKVTLCTPGLLQDPPAEVDDYVLNLPLLLDYPEDFQNLRKKKRGTLSYYTAIEPAHPNSFLNCHPAEVRFLPWLSRLLDMDGFLRWAAFLWPDNPFDFESYHYQKFKAGGTHFLYPGKNGQPLYSLRFKMLQKGIRDILIFSLYEKQTSDILSVPDAMKKVIKTDALSRMRPCFRQNAEELISLSYEDYEAIASFFLERLSLL